MGLHPWLESCHRYAVLMLISHFLWVTYALRTSPTAGILSPRCGFVACFALLDEQERVQPSRRRDAVDTIQKGLLPKKQQPFFCVCVLKFSGDSRDSRTVRTARTARKATAYIKALQASPRRRIWRLCTWLP